MDSILLVTLIILIIVAIWLIVKLCKINNVMVAGGLGSNDNSLRPNPFKNNTLPPASAMHQSSNIPPIPPSTRQQSPLSVLPPPSVTQQSSSSVLPSQPPNTRRQLPSNTPPTSPSVTQQSSSSVQPSQPPNTTLPIIGPSSESKVSRPSAPLPRISFDTRAAQSDPPSVPQNKMPYIDNCTCYPPINVDSESELMDLRNAKKALAFPGGGIRGVIQASFLFALQNSLTELNGNVLIPIEDSFDIIAGTSTGAIIAAALRAKGALDEPEDKIKETVNKIKENIQTENASAVKLINNVPELSKYEYKSRSQFIYNLYMIFGRSIFQPIDETTTIEKLIHENIVYKQERMSISSIFKKILNRIIKPLLPKYTEVNLEIILSTLFGNQKLNEVNKDLIIMASNLTSKRCTMFRSWQTPKIQDGKIVTASVTLAENRHMVLEKVNDEDELTPLAIPQRYLLREVVRASTAAPTFFRPQAVHITRLDSAASSDAQEYIDGGIMVNNASDLALMELMSKYPDSKCVIVTIGNGLFGKSLNEKVMGTEEVRTTIVTQLSDIIKAPMKGSEYRSIYTLKKLIDFANRRDPAHPVVHWIHINYIGEGITNSFSAMDNVKPDHIENLRKFGMENLYPYLDRNIKKALLAVSLPSNESGDNAFRSIMRI